MVGAIELRGRLPGATSFAPGLPVAALTVGIEVEVGQLVVEQEAVARHGDAGAPGGLDRRRVADHVAPLVDHREVRGVRGPLLGVFLLGREARVAVALHRRVVGQRVAGGRRGHARGRVDHAPSAWPRSRGRAGRPWAPARSPRRPSTPRGRRRPGASPRSSRAAWSGCRSRSPATRRRSGSARPSRASARRSGRRRTAATSRRPSSRGSSRSPARGSRRGSRPGPASSCGPRLRPPPACGCAAAPPRWPGRSRRGRRRRGHAWRSAGRSSPGPGSSARRRWPAARRPGGTAPRSRAGSRCGRRRRRCWPPGSG